MLYALLKFLSVCTMYVHTQSLKIRIEDESKSFFLCFQRNCGLRELESSYSQVLTNCCIGGKKLETTRSFFQCVHIAKEATKLPAGEANQKERKMCEN